MHRLLFLLSLTIGLLCLAGRSSADEAADRATARQLATEGHQALLQKDYATAYDRFRRADELLHAPTLTVGMARSLVGLGRLVDAQEAYQRVIREGVDKDSPEAWQRARSDAQEELAEIQPRLSWLTISVQGPAEAQVFVDDAELPRAAVGVRRATDPGERRVRATASGYLPAEQQVTLTEGQQEAVELVLQPDPNAQVAAVPAPVAPMQPPPAPAQKKRSNMPAYVAFGIGGAGLLVSVVTGALMLNAKSDLDDACTDDGVCPASEQDTLDNYHTLGSISAVGLGVAVAGAGTGLALFLTNRSSERANTRHITPYVGLGSVGASGRF